MKMLPLLSANRRLKFWHILFAASLLGGNTSSAATKTWLGGTIDFETPGNWSPTGVPSVTGADVVIFGLNAGSVAQPSLVNSTVPRLFGGVSFTGAGWVIGGGTARTASIGSQTAFSVAYGTNSANFGVASQGSGTNEFTTNVIGTASSMYVGAGNTLLVDGTWTQNTQIGNIFTVGNGTTTVNYSNLGFQGGGTLTVLGAFNNNVSIELGAGGNTLNLNGGYVGNAAASNFGVGGGSTTLPVTTVNVNSAFNNATSTTTARKNGLISVSGAGTYDSITSIVNGGELRISDVGTANAARVGDTNLIGLNGGALTYLGNSAGSTETANIRVNAGASTITVASNGAQTTLTNNATVYRGTNGTVLIRGTNLGAATGDAGRLIFTNLAATDLVGGTGAAGSTTVKIVPWAIGDTSISGAGTGFVTHDATNGFRLLTASEYATALPASGTTTDNVSLSGTSSMTVAKGVNSLLLQTGATVSGTSTLTVTSGAIIAQPGSSITTTTLTAPRQLIFHVLDDGTSATDLTISSAVTGGQTFIKSGTGTMLFSGNATASGALYVNQGTLKLGSVNAFSTTGVAANVLGGATLDLNGNDQIFTGLSEGGAGQVDGDGIITNSSGTSARLTLTGASTDGLRLTGNLTVEKVGTGTATPNNGALYSTYTGRTIITGGALAIGGTDDGVQGPLGAAPATTVADQLILNGGTLSASNTFNIQATRGITVGGATSNTGTIDTGTVQVTISSKLTAGTGVAGIQTLNITGSPTAARSLIFNGAGDRIDDALAVNIVPTTTFQSVDLSSGNETIGSLAGNANSVILMGNKALTAGGNGSTTTYAGVIKDGGLVGGTGASFIKTGAGVMTLSGANTYTGQTSVSGGSLLLGNATTLQSATGLVLVNGGTLTSGVTATTLGGSLTMSSGAITPNGTSVGMLTLAANKTLTLTGGTLGLTLATTSSFDQILGGGTGTFSLSNSTLDLGGVTAAAGMSYQILSGFTAGSVSGISFTNFASGDGSTPNLSNAGLLSFTAVPEPSTWVACVGMCLLLAGHSFRRRRA